MLNNLPQGTGVFYIDVENNVSKVDSATVIDMAKAGVYVVARVHGETNVNFMPVRYVAADHVMFGYPGDDYCLNGHNFSSAD